MKIRELIEYLEKLEIRYGNIAAFQETTEPIIHTRKISTDNIDIGIIEKGRFVSWSMCGSDLFGHDGQDVEAICFDL